MPDIGFCQCGCGELTKIAKYDDKLYGHVKGKPHRYIYNHHRRSSPVEYIIDEQSGCWIWQRYVRPDGYGEATVPGVGCTSAHRVIYERLVGKIPKGLDLDHLCRNRRCVNPDHLEPVTRKVNLARGQGGVNNFKKKKINARS